MKKVIYTIDGLDCANCASKIERHLNADGQVAHASLDFATGRLFITFKEESWTIAEVSAKIAEVEEDPLVIDFARKERKDPRLLLTSSIIRLIIRILVSVFLLVIATYVVPHENEWLVISLYVVSLLIVIYDITWKTILKIVRLRNPLDENLLLTISAVGAFMMGLPILGAHGEYVEGILIIIFYQIGQIFEEIAVNKSRTAITRAVNLGTSTANQLVDGQIQSVRPEDLKVDDIIIIKIGEVIPVDGVVTSGQGTIDTSSLTGEFMPVTIEENDSILSGSILRSGSLTIRVSKVYHDSAIAKILDLVSNSGENKSNAEKFITKFARIYTPVVFLIAVLIAFVPLFFPGQEYKVWIYNALSVLVVSCPCAVVISIPLAFFSGIGLASKHGVIIKGTNYLDVLSKIGYILTDKTGTLTYGYFEVKKVVPNGIKTDVFWEYLIAAESQSNHPIAKAILHDKKQQIKRYLQENYREIPGFGVETTYQGKRILVGKASFLRNEKIVVDDARELGTIIHMAVDNVYVGYVVLNDTAKTDSKSMIQALRKMHIQTVLLSGDQEGNVKTIAEELGIEKYFGQLDPEDKLRILESYLSKETGKVGFVGDGVNDAPAIIRSDVGFAMSGIGSDIAVQNAQVIIVNDNPMKVVDAIKISKMTRRVATFNIVFSLVLKFGIMALIIFGVLGEMQMTIAMLADTGLTVLMIVNSLLLLYRKI